MPLDPLALAADTRDEAASVGSSMRAHRLQALAVGLLTIGVAAGGASAMLPEIGSAPAAGALLFQPLAAACAVLAGLLMLGLARREHRHASSARDRLAQREREFRHVFEAHPLPMWIHDVASSRILAVNDAAVRCYGYTRDRFLAMTLSDIAIEQPSRDSDDVAAAEPGSEALRQHRASDGGVRWCRVAGADLRFRGLNARAIVAEDVTDRARSEARLRLAAAAFENSRDAIVMTDARGVVVAVNPAFTSITGYAAAEVLGQDPRFLKANESDERFYASLWEKLRDTGHWEGEFWNRRKDGTMFPARTSISAVRGRDGAVTHYVGVVSDISEQKRAEAHIRDLAYYDALTGLPNRRLFEDRLHAIEAEHVRFGREFALLFINLDHFKRINDSFGYAAGDAALRHVATCLRRATRDSDTLARWGGDEFVLVLPNTNGEGAAATADKLARVLAEPYVVDGHATTLGACVGISLYPRDGTIGELLLRNAGAAMHVAKREGRNQRSFFRAEVNAAAREQLRLEGELRNALGKRELHVVFQPQVSLLDGRPTGVEALLRWRHPKLGDVPPSTFIPIAESIGIIGDIGLWVLRETCLAARSWRNAGLPSIRAGVNLSAIELRDSGFVSRVEQVLNETGFVAELLEFEVTEGLLVERTEHTLAQFRALQSLGVGLAIDDFGTGYSNLAYLQQLPVTKIKIDKTFVHHLEAGAKARAIVKAIAAVSRELDLSVVAEGVETPRHAALAREAGCAEAQGYAFAYPMPADALAQWLEQRTTSS
jgi:diguanylate cyclase (GGDEF)-like protein/PAS domain S-box-containing protein